VHKYKRILLVLLFLALLLALFQLSGLRAHFSLAFLHQQLLENKLSGLAIFVLLFAVGNLIQIPGWIFLAAAVLALGRTWGGVATYVAATFSCCFTFFTIRLLGGDALRELNNSVARKLFARGKVSPLSTRHPARPAAANLFLLPVFRLSSQGAARHLIASATKPCTHRWQAS
jgi:uncharacterized membrane protein YdjX (TVP38/TMEM64 family)